MLQENEFRPKTIEPIEIEKYSFEDGLQKTIDKIKEIAKQKKIVTVALVASDTDVGKTYFCIKVGQKISEHNTLFVVAEKSDRLEDAKHEINLEKRCGNRFNAIVIFFENEFAYFGSSAKEVLKNNEQYMAKQAKKLNLPIDKFDLKIALYRPDKPFSVNPNDFADIVIENEGAFDKKR